MTPTRASIDDEPGALQVSPRLLRPARWRFKLVDAATEVGTEGTEARVDQIQPTLQVNPAVGFVLPDHLDESLEVFGIDGAPIGELLHEPVSGGVMWEIAPLREGPADAGPLYGLTPSQLALGRFAAGLVAADASARAGRAARSRRHARVVAVGAAARDRHHALERRHLRGARQRARCGTRRSADCGRARAIATRAHAADRRRSLRSRSRRGVDGRGRSGEALSISCAHRRGDAKRRRCAGLLRR